LDVGVDHNWGSSHTLTLRPTLSTAGSPQGVPPSYSVNAVWRCRVAWVRSGAQRARGSGTTRKQPANLAVEGADESLSILPDYTPTVRPPPKRSWPC
jgi:hypothetical protein